MTFWSFAAALRLKKIEDFWQVKHATCTIQWCKKLLSSSSRLSESVFKVPRWLRIKENVVTWLYTCLSVTMFYYVFISQLEAFLSLYPLNHSRQEDRSIVKIKKFIICWSLSAWGKRKTTAEKRKLSFYYCFHKISERKHAFVIDAKVNQVKKILLILMMIAQDNVKCNALRISSFRCHS